MQENENEGIKSLDIEIGFESLEGAFDAYKEEIKQYRKKLKENEITEEEGVNSKDVNEKEKLIESIIGELTR